MKLITLSRNLFAQVDDENFDYLNQWKWNARKHKNTFYAGRSIWGKNRSHVYMHRQILKFPKNSLTDHIDGNGLNNQRNNLRVCSVDQNQMNRSKSETKMGKKLTSKYKGVSWDKLNNKWKVRISFDGKHKYLGLFNSENEAARRYNSVSSWLFGNFAKLNQVN